MKIGSFLKNDFIILIKDEDSETESQIELRTKIIPEKISQGKYYELLHLIKRKNHESNSFNKYL